MDQGKHPDMQKPFGSTPPGTIGLTHAAELRVHVLVGDCDAAVDQRTHLYQGMRTRERVSLDKARRISLTEMKPTDCMDLYLEVGLVPLGGSLEC